MSFVLILTLLKTPISCFWLCSGLIFTWLVDFGCRLVCLVRWATTFGFSNKFSCPKFDVDYDFDTFEIDCETLLSHADVRMTFLSVDGVAYAIDFFLYISTFIKDNC